MISRTYGLSCEGVEVTFAEATIGQVSSLATLAEHRIWILNDLKLMQKIN